MADYYATQKREAQRLLTHCEEQERHWQQASLGNNATGPESYLTRKQTLALLKISRATLWRLDRQGITTPYKIGVSQRDGYKYRDIERLLAERGAGTAKQKKG